MEEIDHLAHEPNTVVVSCEMNLNLDYLIERLWEALGLLRIYTKKRGEYPDFERGVIMRFGSTIVHVVEPSACSYFFLSVMFCTEI